MLKLFDRSSAPPGCEVQKTPVPQAASPGQLWDAAGSGLTFSQGRVLSINDNSHLEQPLPLLASLLSCCAVPVQSKKCQQQVGQELADVKGHGPVHSKLCVNCVRGVLCDHQAASVHVAVQQCLGFCDELGLQACKH